VQVGGVAQEPGGGLADRRRTRTGRCGLAGPPGPEVLPDRGDGAAVSAFTQFCVEPSGVGASLVPALAQVGVVGMEVLGALSGAAVDQEQVGVGGPGESADGVAAQLQLVGDLHDGATLIQQGVDGGVPLPGADSDPVVSALGGRDFGGPGSSWGTCTFSARTCR